MPYRWTKTSDAEQELRLWPHNSLPPRGATGVVLAVFLFGLIPLFSVLGSALLWGLLPFLLLTVLGLWLAFEMNYRTRSVFEVLTLDQTHARLIHNNPRKGDHENPRKGDHEWSCNRYWARPKMHTRGGPVPHYVTLIGDGREVEIGAFLSEDERIALFDDLNRKLRDPA